MPDFKDRVVLITGATAGIGAATAEAFAAAGAHLVLTGRTTAAGEELAGRLRARGARAKFVTGDVSKEESVRAWIAAAIGEFGRLNVAINNAGVEGALGPVTEQTVDNFEHVFAINVRGLMLSLKHEIPIIAKQGGAIVNVSSMVGDIGMAGASVYVARTDTVSGLGNRAFGSAHQCNFARWRRDSDVPALHGRQQGNADWVCQCASRRTIGQPRGYRANHPLHGER